MTLRKLRNIRSSSRLGTASIACSISVTRRSTPSARPSLEPIEVVALDLAAPGPGEGVPEDLAHAVGLEPAALVGQPEVVDPDRRCSGGPDLEGALVEDLDAHVLEQRQGVREQEPLSGAEELEAEEILRR